MSDTPTPTEIAADYEVDRLRDDVDRLRAKVARLRARVEEVETLFENEIARSNQQQTPQPIETAPTDGTDMLLHTPARGWVRGRWNDDKSAKKPRPYWTNQTEWLWGVTVTRADQPTHWLPLPPPPHETEA